jgi:hypothetical protein
MTFEAFPKIPRLSKDCVVSEKIDGTNAQIYIVAYDAVTAGVLPEGYTACINDIYDGSGHVIYAGSRTRLITPGKTTDNYGFAAWVQENASELVKLGPGRHFGEWWGKGIQRNYGLTERRFSLFHTHGIQSLPSCVHVVPQLYVGPFDTNEINKVMTNMDIYGSVAAPGFMSPEGIIVWHEAAKQLFKRTFDDRHKEAA